MHADGHDTQDVAIPFFGARRIAHQLTVRTQQLEAKLGDTQKKLDAAMRKLEEIGALPLLQLEKKIRDTRRRLADEQATFEHKRALDLAELSAVRTRLDDLKRQVAAIEAASDPQD